MWASFLLGMPNWAKTAPRPMERRSKDSKVFQDSRLHRFSPEAHPPPRASAAKRAVANITWTGIRAIPR